MEDERYFITEDKWLRLPGGFVDVYDEEVKARASGNGRYPLHFINTREMLEKMKEKEPEKYREFESHMAKQAGLISLTFEDLVKLASKGNERLTEFSDIIAKMDLVQAIQVRRWRIEGRMTWRSLARSAFQSGWFGRSWRPPSNQIMGMALAEKAASLVGENFRESPWN